MSASPTAPGPVIRFEQAGKAYPDGTTAVEALTLDVRRGELLVLVGPSGCGKSTTLRMVNRLVEATSGRVLVEGQDVAEQDPVQLRRRIGYVIQDVGLFPHRTVAQNVATVPHLLGWDRAKTRARVDELLELVGLDPPRYRRRFPAQLSGGERQRVGVARALAADPPVLLMDEPFGAVDPSGRRRLQQEFRRIQRRLGTTVIFVTHDVDEAVRLGDRVVVLSRGGHVEQVADPVTLLAAPATPAVADLVGSGGAVRLLGVGTQEAADVDGPVLDGATRVAAVALGTPWDEVFTALVAAGGRLPVVDGAEVVGSLTPAAALAAVRRLVETAGA